MLTSRYNLNLNNIQKINYLSIEKSKNEINKIKIKLNNTNIDIKRRNIIQNNSSSSKIKLKNHSM